MQIHEITKERVMYITNPREYLNEAGIPKPGRWKRREKRAKKRKLNRS